MFPEESDYTPEDNAQCAVRFNFRLCWPHRPDGPATITGTAFPVSGDEIARMTRRVKKETA